MLDALRSVEDPDLHRDIVSLDFVKNLTIEGGKVAFEVELTTPACPMKDQMRSEAEAAVQALDGVTDVSIEMTSRVRASQPLMGDKGMIPGVKNVLAVSSGKGGVGKSTVAVNLACALQTTGARVGILDADVYGPNVPLMLGLTDRPKTTEQKIHPLVLDGLQVMSIALLIAEDQPVIWRGPMLHSAIKQFLFDVTWDDLDYLVVDLPPGTGDAQLSLSQQAHIMGSIIVTTPQAVSVLDVKKAIRMFQTVKVPILGVVENMSYFSPPGSDERYEIFGKGGAAEIEREFDIPVLQELPIDPSVRAGGDDGKPVVWSHPDSPIAESFRNLAGRIAARVSTLNAS
ncbi:MAG: Mrp/NBP35 family ATP-binding protein [Planctomycetota bacterium]|nr:Mrp/NBP35 family ATP-binding protein [Planctomycetota bacterium]